MEFQMITRSLGLTSACIMLLLITGSIHAAEPAASKEKADADDCKCKDMGARYYTLKTDKNGKVLLSDDGKPQVIKMEAKPKPPVSAESSKQKSGTRTDSCADCRTEEQGSTSGRESCNSPQTVFTVPRGYYFSVQSRRDHWSIETGSENDVNVIWDDYVEVAPGISAPRTIRVSVHARSDGPGTHGHSACCVEAWYYEIPSH
jgi:hypothetical protein